MTARQTKRDPKVAIPATLNPRYREVIETYLVETVEMSHNGGTTDFSEVPEDISGVFVQSPNYFGIVEEVAAASEAAHAVGALAVAVCDPISLAVLESPGSLGADVAGGGGGPFWLAPVFGRAGGGGQGT